MAFPRNAWLLARYSAIFAKSRADRAQHISSVPLLAKYLFVNSRYIAERGREREREITVIYPPVDPMLSRTVIRILNVVFREYRTRHRYIPEHNDVNYSDTESSPRRNSQNSRGNSRALTDSWPEPDGVS